MKKNPLFLTAICILTFGAQALAEREVEPAKSASHIVTGTVTTVFTHDGKENDEYLVSIRIQNIEKGDGYETGDTIFAYAYQRKADAPRVPASSGHSAVPKEGQLIKARIKRGSGKMEALYPNWFDVLQPKNTRAKTLDESSGVAAKNKGGQDPAKPDPARLKGMKAAVADLEKGVLKQKEYPPLPYGSDHSKFVRLLKSECGVEWQVVKTGESTPSKESRAALRRETAGYNAVMRAEIEQRFGRDILNKLMKKARAR
jgi:hypothetical protein